MKGIAIERSGKKFEIAAQDLDRVFSQRFPDPPSMGWGPRMRHRFRHFDPDEHYEAAIARLVGPETEWLDVGAGRNLFPQNLPLSRELADRCALLVGVDPDPTIEENPYLHQRIRSGITELRAERTFDLVTLRMVAEHLRDPDGAAAALARLVKPGGIAVIYTVHRWSPVPLIARIVPSRLQNSIKSIFWPTEAKDTFPVVYRMNTRRTLKRLFERHGFREGAFRRLDDCRVTSRFRLLQFLELSAWKLLRGLGLPYPEHCLLGIYSRLEDAPRAKGETG